MTTRELFKRRVIELIHGLPYEEALKIEGTINDYVKVILHETPKYESILQTKIIKKIEGYPYFSIRPTRYEERYESYENLHLPITIGRVMKALSKVYGPDFYDKVIFAVDIWKLTNECGSEYTDDSQTEETIEKLYELLKIK